MASLNQNNSESNAQTATIALNQHWHDTKVISQRKKKLGRPRLVLMEQPNRLEPGQRVLDDRTVTCFEPMISQRGMLLCEILGIRPIRASETSLLTRICSRIKRNCLLNSDKWHHLYNFYCRKDILRHKLFWTDCYTVSSIHFLLQSWGSGAVGKGNGKPPSSHQKKKIFLL